MAVDAILRETAESQADLLVVGSHGKGWAQRWLVGSVTEQLLNHRPTALLVVPPRVPQAVDARLAQVSPAIAIA
jgi:nucleotide-binding universal stress UspA family protein